MILHLIQRSPFSSTTLTDCLSIIGKDDSILFMQDGVYALNHPILETVQHPRYTLQDDVEARGLITNANTAGNSKADTSIESIDYSKFVQLCTLHEKVISWF